MLPRFFPNRLSAGRRLRAAARRVRRLCYFGVRLPEFPPYSLFAGKETYPDPSDPVPGETAAGKVPVFFRGSGVYPGKSLTVKVSAPEGCTLAFTTNGKEPSSEDNSGLRKAEVLLTWGGGGYLIENRDLMVYPEIPESFLLDDPSLPSGRVLRAALVSASGRVEKDETGVFFLTSDLHRLFPGCLVVSVAADPADLLDYDRGILATGAVYDAWKQSGEAQKLISERKIWEFRSNFTQHGRAWEKPCLLQIYDGGKAPVLETGAGIRVAGNVSRSMRQKSFNLYFRKKYGAKYLDYELFEGIGRCRSFRLLSGGNNAEWLKFKESLIKDLVSHRRFATLSSRPAVLFLNGEYWGPYLLTEKPSAHMLRAHYGVRKRQVILIKEGKLDEGKEEDLLLYTELMSFAGKDLTDPCVWTQFCQVMDIRSMADYFAVRIYFGDFDWRPDKNHLLWRTRDRSYNGGRWQYILYDTDYSSGLFGIPETAPETDHFSMARECFLLFSAALKNREFAGIFLKALEETGGTDCSFKRVKRLMAAHEKAWKPLMRDCYRRYGDTWNLWMASRRAAPQFFMKRYDLLLPLVRSCIGEDDSTGQGLREGEEAKQP